MLGYDLTETKLACSRDPIQVPTEGELLAILVALMLLDDCAFSELAIRKLKLTRRNRDQVEAIICSRLTPLVRDFVRARELRVRLNELSGLAVVVDETR